MPILNKKQFLQNPNALKTSSDFLIYTSPDEEIRVEARLFNENIRLNQNAMSELFAVQQPAIAKHLKNIFENGELSEDSVHSILEYTTNDGKTYKTKFYNLDTIISVGYRVNSKQATKFRIRTTKIKNILIKKEISETLRLSNNWLYSQIWKISMLYSFNRDFHSQKGLYS
jgi:hypothetical protein